MNNVLLRNNVNMVGKAKKTIVFGHGFGCDQNVWRFMIPFFEKDYRIVLYDYVGSGKSDFSSYNIDRYKNLYGYAEDLLDILDAINPEPVIFVGHSVSSMIGLIASIKKPEYFKSLIMIGPSPRYLNELPNYYGGFSDSDVKELLNIMEMNYVGWATMNASALMNNPDRPMLGKYLEETFSSEDPVIMRNFAEATFMSDHRSELGESVVPSLIIQCSEDSIVPIGVAEYLQANLKDSELVVIDVKGHYPNISQPDKTAELIKIYIDNLDIK